MTADHDEAGFTLLETVVSISVISIVIAALGSFFVTTTRALRHQAATQTAAEIATHAISTVRSMRGAAIVSGRDRASTDAQWDNPAPGAAAYLADSARVWDEQAAAGAGATAAVPTAYQTVTLNRMDYRQYWYIGQCWQPAAGGDCGSTAAPVAMFRVVVAVTWPDHHCDGGTCGYVTSTLISSASDDPVFKIN
jgi:prepilin-type N-terminal cleavage/methylation domain-containing protein